MLGLVEQRLLATGGILRL